MIYYRKNHWYIIIIDSLKIIKKLWPLILVAIIPSLIYGFLSIFFIMMSIFTFSFFRWINEFIIIDNNNLLYKKGIFYTEKVKIPLSSISLVEFNKTIVYRIIGLRKIKIESISPHDRKFEITIVLKKQKISEFQRVISKFEDDELKEELNIENTRNYKLSLKHLLILSTLRSNIILGIGTIYSIIHLISDFNRKMGNEIGNILLNNIKYGFNSNHKIIGLVVYFFLLLVVMICVVLIFSILGLISRYYKFRVYRSNNHIYISHGLLVRKNYSIKIQNIHAIKVEQNFINQVLDLYNIKASVVGYGNEMSESEIMFPLCTRDDLSQIISEIVPEFMFNAKQEKPPKKAFNNFYISWTSYSVIFALAIYYFFDKSFVGFFAVPIMVLWRYLIRRNSALGISDDILYFSSGSFIRRITLIRASSMIECVKVVNLFQRRKKFVIIE